MLTVKILTRLSVVAPPPPLCPHCQYFCPKRLSNTHFGVSMSNGSDAQMDGTENITSTVNAGGNHTFGSSAVHTNTRKWF